MPRISVRALTGTTAVVLAIGGAALFANSANGAGASTDGQLANDFNQVTRSTAWNQVDNLHLDFQTYHTEGLAITDKHIFLSAVQIIEPTQKYPSPVNGYDRTPGKGVGHLFVMDRQGRLQKDLTLGEGYMYHPGGIDYDGENVWVPVAEYRPNSSSIIYKVNATNLKVSEQFRVQDHIGGIVKDATTGDLVGNTWGSRKFYDWTPTGQERRSWPNPSHFIDYQDCQYVDTAKAICSGVANLGQTPSAGAATSTYELGGLALVDLHSHEVLHEFPFQKWSAAGHVMTRNPVKMAADGTHLTLWAAPDNGEETNGTELFTFTADVP